MIGIYKITNPKGKVYIGQSIDIKRRFREYKSRYKSAQTKLINSFNKYGIDNHLFEVIIECNECELNDLERYYQDSYNVLENGLNCILTKSNDKSGKLSKEIKVKISEKLKGRVFSEEYKNNMSNVLKGRVFTEEWKIKLSDKAKQRGIPKGLHLKSSATRKGKEVSIETRLKLSNASKGRKLSGEHIQKITDAKKKEVICIISSKKWASAKECAIENRISQSHMWNILNGHRKNNTSFRYLNE